MITIIHPSRGRSAQAYKTAMQWISKIGVPDTEFEYCLSLDSDDPELHSYQEFTPILNFLTFANRSAIDAINNAAKFYSEGKKLDEDFLIVISDDFECPDSWGQKIKELVGTDTNWILKTQDGIQNWVITLPIMDWKFYRMIGHVYHPDYRHGWCDTELTCVAELTGKKLTSNILFKHNHYSIGGIKDSISERADKWFEQGRKVFQERINKNFDLYPEQRVGLMEYNVYSKMQQK